MNTDDISKIFNDLILEKRDKIIYSKDYKDFDEMYEIYNKDHILKKENQGVYTIITRGNNDEKCK